VTVTGSPATPYVRRVAQQVGEKLRDPHWICMDGPGQRELGLDDRLRVCALQFIDDLLKGGFERLK
jgi:hypothetical protein